MSRSIENPDNTTPVALQGGRHGSTLQKQVNRASNLSPQQAGSAELNLQNNANVLENVPVATKLRIEDKHSTILTSAYVDKSTEKVEGAVSAANGSGTCIVQERSEEDLHTPNHVVDMPPLWSRQNETEKIFGELDSWRNEGSRDRFSGAIEEQRYEEERSSIVTGLILPPLACIIDEVNGQQMTESIFPPLYPERELSSESNPLRFWCTWPSEQ